MRGAIRLFLHRRNDRIAPFIRLVGDLFRLFLTHRPAPRRGAVALFGSSRMARKGKSGATKQTSITATALPLLKKPCEHFGKQVAIPSTL
jgi:hypothetical protein